jgi:uncharacterized membrane protein
MLDKNFFSAMLMNFYHKKVIDIKIIKKGRFSGKDPWIKINQHNVSLDKIETKFLSIIKNLKHKKDDQGYFNLKKDIRSFSNSFTVKSEFKKLHKEVKKQGEPFIDRKGRNAIMALFILLFIILQFPLALSGNFFLIPLYIVLLVVLLIMSSKSAIFIKFKEDYYKEYQHWQAYRKYLLNSFSITSRDHEAVKMWDHVIVYATALGAAKKVLKELKKAGVINEKNYALYTGIYVHSGSFASASGAGGGGMGGAAGGGVGGGGGGGR